MCVPGGLRTEVVEAATRSGLPVTVLCHAQEAPHAYADVLMSLWGEPYEWVLLEQDTAASPATLSAMVSCEHEWCTLPHWVGTHWETRSLGVARFSLQLRRRLPQLMEWSVGKRHYHGTVKSWRVCDTEIARQMDVRGILPHVHPGTTDHLHTYSV